MSKKITIVGGGTAGWMSALIFNHLWQDKGFKIELIESSEISTVGVGEGSTPALKVFFDKLGIDEHEWMSQCSATYKCGITFKNWSTIPDFNSYHHPFPNELDNRYLSTFTQHCQRRLQGENVFAHPDEFFLATQLSQQSLSPIAQHSFPFEQTYGYHFDATLLGQFLAKKAQQRGIIHTKATIEHVSLNPTNGNIKTLHTSDGQAIDGDLFVDCSGFISLLMTKALGVDFHSYQELLFNDKAIAIPTSLEQPISSQTVSTALNNGWAWKIPLTNRQGNGYVYSSSYCDSDQAETELRAHLGILDCDIEARHLSMKVGRLTKHWHKNCLAVGLSQGFIEPLEATALLLIQQTAAIFAQYWEKSEWQDSQQQAFNQRINDLFDGVKDYIVAHYKTNTRNDTQYWRDNQLGLDKISPSLQHILQCWQQGGDLSKELKRQNIEQYYPNMSWYCLLAGMGIFPNQQSLRDARPNIELATIQDFFKRCALNFPTHQP
ncbi:tryptophan halogenase family protein [Psychrobium sp. 1_MG-2023]|uniref:tryptophan halogenase family protein n=1 Tax=Psychrobium sp. 1_MG-2023 TaxID=3062624 RepID=UPI0026C7B09D|nr:tryptophan halogenase family protein [Psychrobium sp. 1_MG-2023]MDP2560043.1 tryptophan 7-halogenase [Psychrobium sp. 1_MG-2023]